MERITASPKGVSAGHALAALIGAVGALLAGGGAWLLVIGGSPGYAAAGFCYLVASALLWRQRARGAWLALALLGVTVGWALWEGEHPLPVSSGATPMTYVSPRLQVSTWS